MALLYVKHEYWYDFISKLLNDHDHAIGSYTGNDLHEQCQTSRKSPYTTILLYYQ